MVGKRRRQRRAMEAQNDLLGILSHPEKNPSQLVEAASQQVWALSRRHGIGLPKALCQRICRGCHRLLRGGVSSRIRLHGNLRTTTCLHCGKVRRLVLQRSDRTSSEQDALIGIGTATAVSSSDKPSGDENS